uniref:hypothetical protein n=1 Tax=Anaerolinea sp. TaxID=1872519 RepID=UPI002ACD3292
ERYPRAYLYFIFEDFDFPQPFLRFWKSQEVVDKDLWAKILKCILDDWEVGHWEQSLYISNIYQRSERPSNRLEVGKPLAKWIFDLRQKRCVRDEHGRLRYPYEVYRKNDHTRPLKGILTFLHRDFDRPGRDALYRALGVPERPQDVQIFLERLRALSRIQPSQQDETYIKGVVGLFSSLAQIWDSLEVSQQEQARQTFREEALLLAEDGTWHTAEDIFQKNPRDLPGVAVLHPALLSLDKWQKILSIPPEPTLEHILDWLRRLPRGEPLAEETLKRVKKILRKYPHQVWEDVQGWLNGRGEWVETSMLVYWGMPQDWEYLHEHLRGQCADASMISHDLQDAIPLPALHRALDWRLDRKTLLQHPQPIPEWLKMLARCLQRVRLTEASQQALVAEQAQRLAGTHIIDVKRGELWAVPYLEGVPAGPAVQKNVVWTQQMLVVKRSTYEEITGEVSRFFPDDRLRKAIHAMWARPVEQIEMYFKEQFAQDFLENPAQVPEQPRSPVPDPESVTLPRSKAVATAAVTATSVSRRDRWGVLWEEKGFTQVNLFEWNNPDGEMILRETLGVFPYCRYSPDGDLLESYFGTEIHANQEVSLPAEVWNVLQSNPERVTLVLWENHKATLYPGARLWEEVQSDRVKLYPETYRLKLK